MHFPTAYNDIIQLIDKVNPIQYASSRNYINGAVTHLSPYISRGVISANQILERIEARGFSKEQSIKLTQELAWREYYQRVWQHLGDSMFEDIKQQYIGIQHCNIPTAILSANTGILAIDNAIKELYNTGYMHNHLRMYVASINCNIAKANWQLPAQWMYYHLLDGDLASNVCSWQWVSGNFSTRPYYCNQENINKYTLGDQQQTFLDKTYDELPDMPLPPVLKNNVRLNLQTALPAKVIPKVDISLPLVIYTSYNLDPLWKQDIKANRILILEPSHFKQFPVSENVIHFILALAKNIEGLQVFSGELYELKELSKFPAIYSKEHPTTNHFPGKKEQRDWIFPETTQYFNSFFSFWNNCQGNKKKSRKQVEKAIA